MKQNREMSETLFQMSVVADLLGNMEDLMQVVQQSSLEHKVEQEYLG